MPAGSALGAAGRRGHEDWFRHDKYPLHRSSLWYYPVPDKSKYGTVWYQVKWKNQAMGPRMKAREEETGGTEAPKRTLGAAPTAVMGGGYGPTSTLEIAPPARVSEPGLCP